MCSLLVSAIGLLARGALLKKFKPLLLIVTAALFSAAAWADGIDPKVIIQKGGGSIPITINNPKPSFGPVTATQNSNCLTSTDACVFLVFQNQTGQTLTHLDILITDNGFTFGCGSFLFFANCSSTDNGTVSDVFFSGGAGIEAAKRKCEEEGECKYKGGEFGLLIDGTASEHFLNDSVTGQTATTPEPGAGLMVLLGALAFGLFKLVRRAV
jgi:hypothetical protein